jgi:negative regulator of flagellin synthesis FlgM
MPFDINPVHRTGAIRPQAGQADAASQRAAQAAPVEDGVAVETSADLLAVTPPIDRARVDEIRQALEDGTYPVVPTKIADAMIAARLMLSTTP